MKLQLPHLVAILLLSATGCALFGAKGNPLLESRETLKPEQVASFESEVPVHRVVRLETSIMSAPATDRRIRELVWDNLDECGPMPPEDRRRLNQSGLRIGVSGGTLPWALQSLQRGDRAVRTSGSTHGKTDALGRRSDSFGSHVAIPQDSSSVIDLSLEQNGLFIPPGKIASMNAGGELKDARCVIELTPIEYGPGWVLIRFLPQIRHGAITTRYNLSSGGVRMPKQQDMEPLYEQQFELKLHTNETVVIGHQEQDEWTVGQLLFQSDSLTSKSERLIALQLVEVENVVGQKSLQVSYSKY